LPRSDAWNIKAPKKIALKKKHDLLKVLQPEKRSEVSWLPTQCEKNAVDFREFCGTVAQQPAIIQ